MISRSALRYYGGKWRLAPWVISHFPPHGCYVEPFCGAASVALRKAPAELQVIYDLDGEVVNFFRILRERTGVLIYAILATPYSRAEYEDAWETCEDPLERARRYYVRAWQGWGGGKGTKSGGWRFQTANNRGKSVVSDWNQVEHLPAIAQRLKQFFIEQDDALAVISRYDKPGTLFYVDPPYLPETRTERWATGAYQCEIDESYHARLLSVLNGLQGMAIVSGYPSDLYDEKLAGWLRVEKRATTTNSEKVGTEVLWISPRAIQNSQLVLFAESEVSNDIHSRSAE